MRGRKQKRKKKFLGTRNCGKGNAKNKRGSGSRGGWGRGGMHKHRFSYVTAYEPDFYGVHGFYNPTHKKVKTINVYDIENMVKHEKIKKGSDGKYELTFEGKILGSGNLSFPVNVKAKQASSGAIEKIEKAGGKVHVQKQEKAE